MGDNLPPSSANVTESGSLNLPESYGPHRPVMGMPYLFLPYFRILSTNEFDSHVTQQARNSSLMMTHTHVSKHVGAAE
jgi:hypothetical protein